ncbi:hypothetical protein AMJ49_02390 [Parcubacteria bacterium DG_74_2]|nr:MAG: hypothetical protein AMJ49_02390 [Parcubacteria bacterium DG_74_2]
MEIKIAIIPAAGLGTRFLPLSKVMPKELFPLATKPVLQYIVEEAVNSRIKEIVFVLSPQKKIVFDYFKKKIKSKRILFARYRSHFLEEIKFLEEMAKRVKFSFVFQKKPLGDGDALLLAEKLAKEENCLGLWADDVIESKIPCSLQMIRLFEDLKKPIVALKRIKGENLKFYGVVKARKIRNRVFKIEKIVEKPEPKKAPSNLAIVGRYIITKEVFDYLKKEKKNKKEVLLSRVLNRMLEDNKEVFGYEFEGKWLECGNKMAYLKSNFYLSLKHKKFGKELKNFLKKNKLL